MRLSSCSIGLATTLIIECQMNVRLQGKAIIVGASGGIGKAVAIALAQQGIELALIGRNKQKIEAIAQNCSKMGAATYPLICDIAKTETIENTVSSAINSLGGLNYLINCAGMSKLGELHKADLEDCDAILDTNLRSHLYQARFTTLIRAQALISLQIWVAKASLRLYLKTYENLAPGFAISSRGGLTRH